MPRAEPVRPLLPCVIRDLLRQREALPTFLAAPCRKIYPAAGVCLLPQWERANEDIAVMKTIIPKSIFAAAALAAVMSFDVPAGHAAGWRHEPWCAVFEYDDVTWDCSYRTFEECYPNVIGGIRGSCNPNPDGPGASAAAPKPKKHRAQQ